MRPSLKLPLLAEREAALETCGYCPKLCRAACPVSNVEPRDTITPWGKMTMSWFAARGDVPVDAEHAKPAWACTGCYACRERCDHRNPVVPTLNAARADFFAADVAPPEATRVAHSHAHRATEIDSALAELAKLEGVDSRSDTGLLVGCAYLRSAPDVARDIVTLSARVAGRLRLLDGCCGAPLLYAGDRKGFEAARAHIIEQARALRSLIVADPGCAILVRGQQSTTLIELAHRRLPLFSRLPELGRTAPVRFHDPCQLSRGLGLYDAPRQLLQRVLGRSPEEFDWRREHAVCSGGGGLLPVTMPANSARIAEARLEEHQRLGGGVLVTACATSLRRFRSCGGDALDLHTILRRSIDAAR
jgi:Fe-S oxidoreductase